MLGVLAYQVEKHELAVELITRALAIQPNLAEAHCNLGLALQALGKLDEATVSYHKALALKPDYVTAHNNLGVLFQELQNFKELFPVTQGLSK